MSWAAVVSGKVRSDPIPSPTLVPPSASASATHQSFLPHSSSNSPHRPCSPPLPHAPASKPTSPSSQPATSKSTSRASHHHRRNHSKPSSSSLPPPPSPTSPPLATPSSSSSTSPSPSTHHSPAHSNPPFPPHLHSFYPSLWGHPPNLQSYRLWAHHIANFMANPANFFHMFVYNPAFQHSVYHAGLTFHRDTDPNNPVLVNLNCHVFGMANRISALAPPPTLTARLSKSKHLKHTHGEPDLNRERPTEQNQKQKLKNKHKLKHKQEHNQQRDNETDPRYDRHHNLEKPHKHQKQQQQSNHKSDHHSKPQPQRNTALSCKCEKQLESPLPIESRSTSSSSSDLYSHSNLNHTQKLNPFIISVPNSNHPASPLSEHSQPQHPLVPSLWIPNHNINSNLVYEPVLDSSASLLINGNTPHHIPVTHHIHPHPINPVIDSLPRTTPTSLNPNHLPPTSEPTAISYEPLPINMHVPAPLTPDQFTESYDKPYPKHFMDSFHMDGSDTDSERYSDGDHPYSTVAHINMIYPFDIIQSSPVPTQRKTGRSKIVSRKRNVRVPSQPIIIQSDKAKAELIAQIEDLFPMITPPQDYSLVREDLLSRLRKIITAEWSKANIDVYGSAGNGLGLRSADFDTSLYMPKAYVGTNQVVNGVRDPDAKSILDRLAATMEASNIIVITKLLDARVPVIKMRDPITDLQVDVCVNNVLAVRNTQLIKAYVDLDPRFRYLCILVKYWAKKRDLNDAYNGTLSSYAYTLMAIHYLQTLQPPVLPCLQQMVKGKRARPGWVLPEEMIKDTVNNKMYNTYFDRTVNPDTWKSKNVSPVHELLVGFFKYYVYQFRYKTDLASIRLGVKALRSVRKWDEKTVYEEWERKLKKFWEDIESARVANEALTIAEVAERRAKENGSVNGSTKGSTSQAVTGNKLTKKERVPYPRKPRLESKHLFCIEDPFDVDHDLSRGMEKAAVSVIRQEMNQTYNILAQSGDFDLACAEYI